MWSFGAAIRPVPEYARLSLEAFDTIRETFDGNDEDTEQLLAEAFEEMEESQPALAQRVSETFTEDLGEVGLALGYFLILSIWLAFEQDHGDVLQEVSDENLQNTESRLQLEEEIRSANPSPQPTVESTVASEQPAALEFVREQLSSALGVHTASLPTDTIADILRMVLLEVLSLSYAVTQPRGYPVDKQALPA